ncbi:MAG: adenine phosphoribosyltransferase [Candidatus Omnitrophica bacterium]|nr:adenine phosphoribosyltransferase [Candidatus Omnitrophota bacterium]MCB9747755.1 adenine phosphoribosyltransferase [Candidatus Omnitrophota bacterium]
MKEALKKSDLRNRIRDIPDFPKEGIIFKDITTLLKDKAAFKKSIDILAKKFRKEDIEYVVGVEARGFIFGAALAYKLGVGFIPVRKKGKLPSKTKSITYELEYGTDSLEIHEDALNPQARVLIVDDLLATGGTIKAVSDLVKNQKAVIAGVAFIVELGFLKGKEKLKDLDVYSVIKY